MAQALLLLDSSPSMSFGHQYLVSKKEEGRKAHAYEFVLLEIPSNKIRESILSIHFTKFLSTLVKDAKKKEKCSYFIPTQTKHPHIKARWTSAK